MHPNEERKKTKPLWAFAALALVALAGCLESVDTDSTDDLAPTATIEADAQSGWNGDEFTFDAQSSSDPNGAITKWHFDFGDGQTLIVDNADDARVKHAYAHGGEYVVTVTVTDDGEGQDEALSDKAQVAVLVNQEHAIEDRAVYAAPVGNQTSTSNRTLEVFEGADRFEIVLHVENAILIGSSEVRVEFRAPDGAVLDARNVTITQGGNQTVSLSGGLTMPGAHELWLRSESGGVFVGGEGRILYDQA